MSSIGHNGGPAFPNPELADEAYHPSRDETGMTLRDYFAGRAMLMIPHMGNGDELQPYEVAHDAYQMADAMLKAREATS